jgi:hypothetical protein
MLTSEQHTTQLQRVRQAIQSGSIETADRKTLIEYSTWLCEPGATDAFNNAAVYEQSCELVRLHLLCDFMKGVEKRSSRVQAIVIVLTLVAIIGTGFQTWYGYKADKRSEEESAAIAEKHKPQQSQTSAPIPAQPQTIHQAASSASLPTRAASAAK